MLTKRKVRRLRSDAEDAYANGMLFDKHYGISAPSGPCRIAFDAGREAAAAEKYVGMSLDTWALVYAQWLRDL